MRFEKAIRKDLTVHAIMEAAVFRSGMVLAIVSDLDEEIGNHEHVGHRQSRFLRLDGESIIGWLSKCSLPIYTSKSRKRGRARTRSGDGPGPLSKAFEANSDGRTVCGRRLFGKETPFRLAASVEVR